MKQTQIEYDLSTLPSSLLAYLDGATIYDSSSSAQAKTLFIDGAQRLFLKIAAAHTLEREYRMNAFLHKHELAPLSLVYTTYGEQDYLLTVAVSGDDGIAESFLQQPERLATALGQHLRKLHSLPLHGCPYRERSSEILLEASPSVQIELQTDTRYQPVDKTIIHGDYCLPNVMMNDFELCGFIDNGDGGIGDRHYDLAWGLWSLQFNLETDRYHDYFLNGYGRDDVDPNGIVYFRQIIDSLDF
ncbi:aminoglycoside 3'-phosphotransferase [Paenibacillus wenxiniae]|uniref:Aminoglycoside 3'-phosphotransferase n=1 Tax=Paenibacillus wenxiniae TaxID=1636843 RepID=A0ABW4RR18_9BACL